jgi:GT2 family glycosyltransferase
MSAVTVVIPNWNQRDLLVQCLELLCRQTYPIDQIVVSDNGSADGSPEAAERAGARVIRLGSNLGFSRAVNSGIRVCRTPWIAIVNNDVEPAPDWLAWLADGLRGKDRWFATGKLLDTKRREAIDGTFDLICRGACAWRAGHGRPDSPLWSQRRTIQLAPFTAALFRTELFDRVGLLDESFESYLEDIDFGLRSAGRGYGGVYVPEAVAYHQGSATLGAWHPETARRMARNQVLLVAKHFPKGWFLRFGWPVLVAQGLWGLVAVRHGAGWPYLRGKWEGLRRFGSVRADSWIADGDAGRILEESEQELRSLQRSTGPDLYWRLYFGLT